MESIIHTSPSNMLTASLKKVTFSQNVDKPFLFLFEDIIIYGVSFADNPEVFGRKNSWSQQNVTKKLVNLTPSIFFKTL